ncbi:hypothetical protein HK405_010561, partial [Cladochytrium tenue]
MTRHSLCLSEAAFATPASPDKSQPIRPSREQHVRRRQQNRAADQPSNDSWRRSLCLTVLAVIAAVLAAAAATGTLGPASTALLLPFRAPATGATAATGAAAAKDSAIPLVAQHRPPPSPPPMPLGLRPAPIVVPAAGRHSASIIFLHGLGDSGEGWVPAAVQLSASLPHVKFVLPSAPAIPLTMANGGLVPAWFDIHGIGGQINEDHAVDTISYGCAVSLTSSLLLDVKIAGFVGLSGFLIKTDRIVKETNVINKETPVLVCHGDQDGVVRPERTRSSADRLRTMGRPVEYHVYRGMGHSSSPEEIVDLARFLQTAAAAVQMARIRPATVPASGRHSATVIILHGLGDSGAGWVPTAAFLGSALPHVKFVLPNAL